MTKTRNQIIFFFLHQNQNIFLEINHNPPPPPWKLNGPSLKEFGLKKFYCTSIIIFSHLLVIWTTFRDFDYFSTIFDISIDDLALSPGTMYRVVLRLCARTICFQSIHTDGVMVIAKPPTTGGINVEHRNITEGGGTEKVCII